MTVNKDYLRKMARVHALGASDIERLEAATGGAPDRDDGVCHCAQLHDLRAARDDLALFLRRTRRARGLQEKISIMLAEESAYRLNAGLQRAGQIAASLEFQKALDGALSAFRKNRRYRH